MQSNIDMEEPDRSWNNNMNETKNFFVEKASVANPIRINSGLSKGQSASLSGDMLQIETKAVYSKNAEKIKLVF